jgi:hypothetical protein
MVFVLALIEAASSCGSAEHKRYSRIAGNQILKQVQYELF